MFEVVEMHISMALSEERVYCSINEIHSDAQRKLQAGRYSLQGDISDYIKMHPNVRQ